MVDNTIMSRTAEGQRGLKWGCLAVVALILIGLAAGGIQLFQILRERVRVERKPPPLWLDMPGAVDWFRIPVARDFSYPLGTERGAFSYNAQAFGENDHLGDDWNGIGGENTDLGDPVYAVATGRVVYAEQLGGGWGGVVLVQHRVEDGEGGHRPLQVFYGHLLEIGVQPGDLLRRGEVVGTVGNAGGRYWAHLHLEMREFDARYIGPGYRVEPEGWMGPTEVIRGALVPVGVPVWHW